MKERLPLLKQSLRATLRMVCMLIAFFVSTIAWSQLPPAQQVASQMKVGWNVGNSLEAICGENAWGNPNINQTLINSVKAAGFNTVRIPVSWDCHATNGVIDPKWLARVKQVVDYCMNANMYAIVNIHWDNGWLDSHINAADQASIIAKQKNYWTQIANYFKSYNERVVFAGSNEPPADDATEMSILLSYHQAFIDAVRATGGNNSSRTLIVQGPSTSYSLTDNLMNTMPTDQIANRLMVEIHYYTSWQFCGMTSDESWGNAFYYWGNGNHSTIEPGRNSTWGEESEVDSGLGLMKTKFVDKGIPVLVGEFGAIKRDNPADMPKHIASRQAFNKYVVSASLSRGMVPVYWDNGAPDFGLFNRSTGAITDQGVVNAIMQGAGGNCTPTAITPYIQVNGGTWQQTSSVTVTSGATVILGPQPTSGGSWSWSGMASGTTREVTLTPTSSGTATATYTNSSGCQSTQVFTITVNGGSTTTYVTIKNRATGLLIDGMGRTSAGSICGQYTGSGSWNQMWILETSGAYVYIKNRNTGLYIDGRGISTNGSYAGQWSSATSDNLQWQQETTGGYVKLKNRATGLYLDGMGRTADASDLGQWSSR